jgi:hypothetical protein
MYSITENIYYSQLSSVAILLQPEPVSHRIIQGNYCSRSLCAIVLRSSPPSNVSACNGQRSSQVFSLHYTDKRCQIRSVPCDRIDNTLTLNVLIAVPVESRLRLLVPEWLLGCCCSFVVIRVCVCVRWLLDTWTCRLYSFLSFLNWILYFADIFPFLAYFQKMKVGLSNHLSVWLCVCVSPINNFEPLGRISWNLVRRTCVQWVIFNPIASVILKLLRFKVVRWALLSSGFGLFMFHGNHGNKIVYCSKFG